jgi:hypothetical protein
MSAAAWTAQTGDADFVAFMAQLIGDAFLAADHGETQTVAMAIAALRDQDDALASMPLDPDEGGADRQTAKRALIRECLTGLDVATGPDLDGFGAWLDALVASSHWIGLISSLRPSEMEITEAVTQARRSAEQIANMLISLDSDTLDVVFGASLPIEGLAVALEYVPALRLPAVASALASASTDDPAYHDALCRAMVTRAAASVSETAAALDSDTATGVMLAAFSAAPAVSAFAASLAARAPQDLAGLAEAVTTLVVPSAVSRLATAIHAGLRKRFGNAVATELVRGFLLLRILGAALPDTLRTQVEELLSEKRSDGNVDGALLRFTDHVVAAGEEASAIAGMGEDPDDIVVLRGIALQSPGVFATTFQQPTPPDPLGTLPANPVTILGQAILRARELRSGGYQWGLVQDLAVTDTDLYLALIEDERMAVMDGLLRV